MAIIQYREDVITAWLELHSDIPVGTFIGRSNTPHSSQKFGLTSNQRIWTNSGNRSFYLSELGQENRFKLTIFLADVSHVKIRCLLYVTPN